MHAFFCKYMRHSLILTLNWHHLLLGAAGLPCCIFVGGTGDKEPPHHKDVDVGDMDDKSKEVLVWASHCKHDDGNMGGTGKTLAAHKLRADELWCVRVCVRVRIYPPLPNMSTSTSTTITRTVYNLYPPTPFLKGNGTRANL